MVSIQSKGVGVIVFLALTLTVVFYITKDLRMNSLDTANTDTNGEQSSEQDNKLDRGYSIEVLPIESKKSAPIPDLNRRVNFETADKNSILKIEEISKKLKIEKNNLSLWIDLGSWRKAILDYEGARLAFEYVVSVNPNYIVPLVNLGDLYQFYLHDNERAEENFKQAIKNNPSFVDSYYRLSELYRLSYKQDTNLASETLKQGLQANPGNLTLLLQLGGYYAEKKDGVNATMYYTKALEQAKKDKNEATVKEIENVLLSF